MIVVDNQCTLCTLALQLLQALLPVHYLFGQSDFGIQSLLLVVNPSVSKRLIIMFTLGYRRCITLSKKSSINDQSKF